jgi:hypothetical protein
VTIVTMNSHLAMVFYSNYDSMKEWSSWITRVKLSLLS